MMKIKNTFIACCLTLFGGHTFAQINMADSSVQAITYWDAGESETYYITTEKIKLKNGDTTSYQVSVYEVELTVLDQTDSSYTIKWAYKNGFSNITDTLAQKMMQATGNREVVYRIDEMGTFKEVVNWEELRDEIRKEMDAIKGDFNLIPGMEDVFNQVLDMFSSKEAIEAVAIKDIQQFHAFYGGKYEAHDTLRLQTLLPNIYGTEPFDAEVSVTLERIDGENEFYTLSTVQEVNQQQLENTVYNYLKSIAEKVGGNPPQPEDVVGMRNEVITTSSIHDSGWLLYSIQTLSVSLGDSVSIEQRTIDLKDNDEESEEGVLVFRNAIHK